MSQNQNNFSADCLIMSRKKINKKQILFCEKFVLDMKNKSKIFHFQKWDKGSI